MQEIAPQNGAEFMSYEFEGVGMGAEEVDDRQEGEGGKGGVGWRWVCHLPGAYVENERKKTTNRKGRAESRGRSEQARKRGRSRRAKLIQTLSQSKKEC